MDYFQDIYAYITQWWAHYSTQDLETATAVSVTTLVVLGLIWAISHTFNKPMEVAVTLSREEQKALLVARNFKAVTWAIDEGLKSACFEKRMSKSEANRWRVKFAEAFGMVELLPYHKRPRFAKLHPIKNAILKMDLKSRLERSKREKPVKLPDAAKERFKIVHRQQRIAIKHNGTAA